MLCCAPQHSRWPYRAGGRRSQEVAVEADVYHCPPRPGACVLAARRHKVDHINKEHAAALHAAGTSVCYAEAVDTENGRPVTNEDLRACIDNKRSNFMRSLPLHIGMLVIVTINKVPPNSSVMHTREHTGYLPSTQLVPNLNPL